MKRFSISTQKKDVIPKNDGQQNLVYQFDYRLEKIIKDLKIVSSTDYLSIAEQVFLTEGFSDMAVSNSGSKIVSQVQISQQKLSFSNLSIQNKCYETIIHELAHAVCHFHYGYSYDDSHGELFVNILMKLVKEHCNISDNDLFYNADAEKVKYFCDARLHQEILTEKEYNEKLKIYNGIASVYKKKSKKESFGSESFIKDNETLATFFVNNKGCFIYTERQLLSFEKDLFVNPFHDKKSLCNIIIISPLFKTYKDGSISKNGNFHSFGFCDFKKAKNRDRSSQMYQLKESASLKRSELIEKHKNIGYKILKPKSIQQFISIQDFFFETAF